MNQKQTKFAHAYVANAGNATQAAIEAGYSEKTAYSQGGRLLNHVEVAAMIRELRDGEMAKLGKDLDHLIAETYALYHLALDTGKLATAKGTLELLLKQLGALTDRLQVDQDVTLVLNTNLDDDAFR